MEAWEWAALGLGILALAIGIATRLGYHRVAFMWWNVENADPWLRNRPLILIPGGLAFILIVVGVKMADRGFHGAAEVVMFAGLFCLCVGLWWFVRKPPEWMKPAWLRAAERHGSLDVGVVAGTPGEEIRRLPVWTPVYWGMLVAIGALSLVAVIFGWSSSVWVGVGMGLVQLGSHTSLISGGVDPRPRGA